jgi:hypothetical protein
MSIATIFANGQEIEPSWSDISITITPYGAPITEIIEISGISWARTVEIGERRGTSGGRVTARTTGAASFEASATFYRSGYRKLLKALVAAKPPTRGNQVQVGIPGFDILVQHTPPGETEIYTTKIKGCRLVGDSSDMAEGSDADTLEITLNPIEVVQIINEQEIVLI